MSWANLITEINKRFSEWRHTSHMDTFSVPTHELEALLTALKEARELAQFVSSGSQTVNGTLAKMFLNRWFKDRQ